MKQLMSMVLAVLVMALNPAVAQMAAAAGTAGTTAQNAPQPKAAKVSSGAEGQQQVYAWFENVAKQYGEKITSYDVCMTANKGEMLIWGIAKTDVAEGRKKAVMVGDESMVPVEAKIFATLTDNGDGTLTITPGADERRCLKDKITYK